MPMVTIGRIELVVPDKVVCHDADHGARLILHSYSDARHCGTLNAKIVRIIMCMGRGSQMKKARDDFRPSVKQMLAERVNFHSSSATRRL